MLMVNPNRSQPGDDTPPSPSTQWGPVPYFAWAFLLSALAFDIWISVFLSEPFRPWITVGTLVFFGLWYAVASWRRRG